MWSGRDFALGTADPSINSGKPGQWHAEKIKRRDQPVGKCQAHRSNCFIAARAYHNSLAAVNHAPVPMKLAEKFHVFHQWHAGKPAGVNKHTASAENSMIATPHPEQEPGVMREAVG